MADDHDTHLFDDLSREDDLGLVVKGHLHLEHQITEFIQVFMATPARCDWARVGFAAKLEIALGLGLPVHLRGPLEAVAKLRNVLAHNLQYSQSRVDAVALYNGLPPRLHARAKETYLKIRGAELRPSKLTNRDLLVILLLSVRQAIQAEVSRVRGAA